MLYYLHLLGEKYEWLDWLRLFQFGTVRAAGACMTALLLSLIFGKKVIRMLQLLKMGQPIRTKEEVHVLAKLHEGKAGTPTMGGVLIVGTLLVSVILWARPDNPFIWALVFVTIGTAILGFVDDYQKVAKKNSKGVSGRVKLVSQFCIALVAVLFLYLYDHPDMGMAKPFITEKNGVEYTHTISNYIQKLWIPFMKTPLDGGIWVLILLPIVIVACSNAVNLTDGLDGLATGCTLTTAAAYAILTYAAGHSVASAYLLLPYHPQEGEVAIFCTALLGAGLGFLWFNCHPAKVFMGDTGSLSIGGMLGMIAICCKQEILLVVIGGVFVMEAGSVMIQVASFKMTGKRVFKMSPIHHHFELKGWEETQVINRFWILSIMCALIGMATLKIR
ncbi:MAG: phospho-N-acetylmuramoyl-pentapeptide-transferase [Verrucomicrobiales bacterium]|nr:phospho-N-acetylmuramoyl-pentapeptide-transferase [Verrucomicrobiales bacterium]